MINNKENRRKLIKKIKINITVILLFTFLVMLLTQSFNNKTIIKETKLMS